ncbi:alpha/beta hydrolase [Nocardia takedensis]|uniref:alpha/beta hydrolase n=1 Tax=Nocardia takedensis TaxID=259390 RepID=UPI0002FA74D2|nr:alpha/beta hydrolase [Nocardia takedensis]
MNQIAELKEFAVVHARAQGIAEYRAILDRITHDGDGPGSWVGEWTAAADEFASRGEVLDAVRRYNLARFPYVDGPARQRAAELCARTFTGWARERGLTRVDVELPGGLVRCWADGLSTTGPRPLVLVSGGIVSIKEHWAPTLGLLRRFGLAGVVMELPGAGENTLRYDEDSWRMIPAILDRLADRADVRRSYALALSFSGHLALRAATEDPRLRGIVTVGAPIDGFFTDRDWQSKLPAVTVATLAHQAAVPVADLPDTLASWALSAERLRGLDIPIAYVASARDEIIPRSDPESLAESVRDTALLWHDDVHGAPGHVRHTQLWSALSLLDMVGGRLPQRALLRVAVAIARLGRI